jgi:hypothetical protein
MALNSQYTTSCLKRLRECFSQLFYDGHQSLAVGLSAVAQADPPCPPSDRLLHVVMAGLQHEPERPQKTGAAALTVPGPEALASSGLGRSITFSILTLHNFIHGHWPMSGGISHNSAAVHIVLTRVVSLCIMYPPIF